MATSDVEKAQGLAYSLFERGVRHVIAQCRGTARLGGIESELPEPGHDVQLVGLRRVDRLLARPGGRTLPRRCCACLGDSEAFLAHELGAEGALGPVLIVGPASEPHAPDRCPPAAREFIDMIELESGARRTTLA
jgi:hypothetical protein